MNRKKGETVFKPITGKRFRFRCHKEIPCFTKCCADLNLTLTPYDIIRIKNRLKLSSDVFLDRYTDTRIDSHPRFPMVVLKMNHDEDRNCPFVTRDGCIIYEDRPGACRIYPLGRATSRVDSKKDTREKFFIVDEEHCLGFQEDTQWTIKEWVANEKVDEYNAMNDRWSEIITSPKSMGNKNDLQRKIQMFYMASYNSDKLRRFIFESRFFDIFQLEPRLRERLASDDVELMKFAFDWLKFSLFGERTIHIRAQNSP
jgi:hypothetical protein